MACRSALAYGKAVSNYPLSYRLTWLPRLLHPSVHGFRPESRPTPRDAGERPAGAVRLVFFGDLSSVANEAPPMVDWDLRTLFGGADLIVGNCESPVVERPAAPFATALGLKHAMDAAFLADALAAAGIDPGKTVLSLANNHALDQGVAGLRASRAAIEAIGARVAGLTGVPTVLADVGDLSVAVDAHSAWRNAGASKFARHVRTAPDPSPPPAELHCALPHWDWEFRHFPQTETREASRRLRATGTRLVVGGHAHVLQPVERRGDALVAYGLGDFLGTAWPRVRWPLRIGGLLVVDVATQGVARGTILDHALVPFVRLREGRRERLLPAADAPARLRVRVAARLAAVLGPAG